MKIPASVKKISPHLYDKNLLLSPVESFEEGEYQPTPKEIRVNMYGHALHLTPWQHCSWYDIACILNIENVRCYTVDSTIGVVYKNGADPIQIAATCVAIIAKLLNTPVSEIKVTVDDGGRFIRKLDPEMAKEIWTLVQAVELPPKPSLRDVIARGTGPAYWFKDVFYNQ